MKRKKSRQFSAVILVFGLLVTSCNNSSEKPTTNSTNTETINQKTMENDRLINFGNQYAAAWCSQKPESVAAYFSSTGSLSVNANAPAVGREAIAKVAAGFMTAFPDMIVNMDSLVTNSNGTAFHWTLTGTNTGPGGTGNKIKISGFELWQIDTAGLIIESKGSFDAEEYNRQLGEKK
ncbi:MAG: nuclear transport factor 2 family protein [Chitinophagaceae bacterium]|nr:nuclear transport factor 2 family protein [Chitinophagaceae bacterium]